MSWRPRKDGGRGGTCPFFLKNDPGQEFRCPFHGPSAASHAEGHVQGTGMQDVHRACVDDQVHGKAFRKARAALRKEAKR